MTGTDILLSGGVTELLIGRSNYCPIGERSLNDNESQESYNSKINSTVSVDLQS